MNTIFNLKNSWAAMVLLAVAIGCTSPSSTKEPTEAAEPLATMISTPGLAASCPFLTKDQQGNTVLSWVQATYTAGNFLMAYAIAEKGKEGFAQPKLIPTTKGVYPHDENLSKLLFRKNGDIMAMFAVSNPNDQNAYAGLVYYTQSFDGGQTWTAPKQLATNAANSIDERYFDMELLPNGEVAAIWLDSRKTTDKEGSSLYYASTNGREGFVNEKVLASQLCQCCRTDLYLDDKQKLHVAYRGILNDSIRDMMYLVSEDMGKSFSEPERISADNWVIMGCPHTGPTIASNQNGTHYAWFTMGGGNGVFYSQKQPGKPFSPRQSVSRAAGAKHPQMVSFGTGKLAIVWDERNPKAADFWSHVGLQVRSEKGDLINTSYLTPETGSANYPVLAPISDKSLLVAYSIKKEGPGEVWCQRVEVEK